MREGRGRLSSFLFDRRITRSSFSLAHDSITPGSRPTNGEFRDDTVSNCNNHHASHHRARQSPFELNGRSCSSNLFFSTRDRDYIAFRAAILARRQFFSSRARPMLGHKYAKLSRRCVNLPQRSLSFHFRSFLDFLHRLKRHTTLVRYKKF